MYAATGEREFSLDDGLAYLQVSREQGRVILSELAKLGYLKRMRRARYIAESPLSLAFRVAHNIRHISLKQEIYEPLLEEVLTKLFERFKQDLYSVVLYGSIARGNAHPTSDIDLLVVAKGLPASFYGRAALIGEILRRVHDVKMRLWKETGRYANIDILPFTPEEAGVLRLLYLDLLFDAIILYDVGGFMNGTLERLRKRVKELGSRRVTMPSGRWYWSLSERPDPGLAIEP